MQKTGEQDSVIQLSWDTHTCPPREAVGLSLLGRWSWTFFYMSLNIHPPSLEIIHLCMLDIPQLQGGTWLLLVWMLYWQPYYLLPAYTHLQTLLFQTYPGTKKEREKNPTQSSLYRPNFTTQNVTSISFNGIYANTPYIRKCNDIVECDSRGTAQEAIKSHLGS